MTEPSTANSFARRISAREALALAGCLALLVALRLPWVGHLLSWDEAMNLCSVRAFAAGGTDYFSRWFWHHPPLFNMLLLTLRPLQPGFAERGELLLIVISSLNLLALFLLNRRVMGAGIALWSCFFLAVLPGVVFYDLWLKQDPLAVLFGLLALYFFVARKPLLSGAALGLALLAKEMAVFYAITLILLWLMQGSRRSTRDLLVVLGLAALISAWWYLAFSVSIRYFVAFALGRNTGTDVGIWAEPWHFFIRLVPEDLGCVGVLLCAAGLVWLARFRAEPGDELQRHAHWWPLCLALPACLIFTLAKGKAAWFLVTLLPAFATLAAVGAWGVLRTRTDRGRRPAQVLAAVVIGGLALVPVIGRDYEGAWQRQAPQLWQGANMSREAAQKMNQLVSGGERALITPMYYWRGLREQPCPIFTYYLKDMPVLVRRADIPLEPLVDLVKKYKLDWIMLSPDPEIGYRSVIEPLMKQYKVPAIFLEGACILKVGGIREMAQPRSPTP